MTGLALMLGFLALLLVVLPLFTMRAEIAEGIEEDPRDRLEERRSSLYESIHDLDFEHSMGKLTDADHRAVRDDLMEEAASVLAAIDEAPDDPALDRWIEDKVRVARGALETVHCKACNHLNPTVGRFCEGCGAPLGGACARCGAARRSGAAFCGECGAAQ